MEETKPFWASKTLWVNVIAIAASVLGAFKVDFLTPEMQLTLIPVVMGVVNIVLRFVTKGAVTVTPSP